MSDEQHLTRLGFWLRIARERSGKSQEGAARELGLSAASKSTVSDWENGIREPKLSQLRALAHYYGVPIDLFVSPPATAFEDLDRLTALATAALEVEAEEWIAEGGSDPPTDPKSTGRGAAGGVRRERRDRDTGRRATHRDMRFPASDRRRSGRVRQRLSAAAGQRGRVDP